MVDRYKMLAKKLTIYGARGAREGYWCNRPIAYLRCAFSLALDPRQNHRRFENYTFKIDVMLV